MPSKKKKEKARWRLLGARAVLERLKALRKEIPAVRAAADEESLHQMRVASRRLRSALGIFEASLGRPAKRWRKGIRRITGMLGRARDLDVQIGFLRSYLAGLEDPRLRLGPQALLDHLVEDRRSVQPELDAALEELEASGLLEEMRKELRRMLASARKVHVDAARPLEEEWVRAGLCAGIEELLSYGPYVSRPECVLELHEMRIAAKRLRYTVEAFARYHRSTLGDALRVAKKLQDLLGEIHDCDVWIEFLPVAIRRWHLLREHSAKGALRREDLTVGIERLEADRKRTRKRLYRKMVKLWDRLESEGFWKDLLRAIRGD